MNSEERSGTATRRGGLLREAALLSGVALAAALLASGCGAGQIAATANVAPAVPGANGEAQLTDASGVSAGTVSVRNVLVVYKDPKGYPKGGTAPLDVHIFNDTSGDVTVTVSSPAAASVVLTGSAGASASASPGAPSAQPSASPPAGQPARLTIPAQGFAVLNPDQARSLRLVGLTEALPAGSSVPLAFDFGGGVTIKVDALVAPPLSPLPRETPQSESTGEG
ncbi:MAG TPA: hypothetical protein VGJ53_16210 [Micromonosporaceae bacterium]